MPSRLALALSLAFSLAPAAVRASADPVCGPHEHVVVEKDEDEGSIVKRCLCDEGYQSEGPGKPCKPVAGAKPAKPGKPAKEDKPGAGDKKPDGK